MKKILAKQLQFIANELQTLLCQESLYRIAEQIDSLQQEENKQGGVGQFFQKKLNLTPNDSRKMVNVVKSLQKPVKQTVKQTAK